MDVVIGLKTFCHLSSGINSPPRRCPRYLPWNPACFSVDSQKQIARWFLCVTVALTQRESERERERERERARESERELGLHVYCYTVVLRALTFWVDLPGQDSSRKSSAAY